MSFPNLSEIVTTTIKNCGPELAKKITQHSALVERLTKRIEDSKVWERAIANMPWKRPEARRSEQIDALVCCLSIPLDHYAKIRSTAELPTQLHQYAGEYGTQLAAIRLTALGVADQYPHWPNAKP